MSSQEVRLYESQLAGITDAETLVSATGAYSFILNFCFHQPDDLTIASTSTIDILPTGTFCSGEWSPEKIVAVKGVHKLGERLANEHPEVSEMYADLDGFAKTSAIAQELLPELFNDYPQFATKVVGFAIRLLMNESTRTTVSLNRKAAYMREIITATFGGVGSPSHLDHQRRAANRRHELGISVDVEAMLAGRGRTAWLEEEKSMVFEVLLDDPEFKTKQGAPDYKKIAEMLNILYHDGKPVRYENSVRSLVGYIRKIEKKNRTT